MLFRSRALAAMLAEHRPARVAGLTDRALADNAVTIDLERPTDSGPIVLGGVASIPTYNRGVADHQYLFVNGRPVRDKLLAGAVRAAYADFLARDRHPVVALFVELDAEQVDVNVHPTKAEVRFRDAGLVRGLIVCSLRHALAEAGHRASTTVAAGVLGAIRTEAQAPALPMSRGSWTPRQIGRAHV